MEMYIEWEYQTFPSLQQLVCYKLHVLPVTKVKLHRELCNKVKQATKDTGRLYALPNGHWTRMSYTLCTTFPARDLLHVSTSYSALAIHSVNSPFFIGYVNDPNGAVIHRSMVGRHFRTRQQHYRIIYSAAL